MKRDFIYRFLELQNILKDTEAVNEALQLEESTVGSRAEDEDTVRELLTSFQLR